MISLFVGLEILNSIVIIEVRLDVWAMVNGNLSLAIDVIGKLWLRAYLVLKLQVKFAVICIFATRTIIMHLESDVFIRFANSVASY